MPQARVKLAQRPAPPATLGELRNIGKAMLADFKLLDVTSVSQLARENIDKLYTRLSLITGARQDPCVHDTFAAAIHQAKTGEALNWWAFTALRKEQQRLGTFPKM